MSNSQNATDELHSLQQEAAELRAERKECCSETESGAEQESQTEKEQSVTDPSQESAGEEHALEEGREPELEKTLQDLVAHIDSVAKGLQEATKEHPSLGLMAAFTSGIVVGYLLTRRNA